MSEALSGFAVAPRTQIIRQSALTIFAIAWRNLWRNRRRTWLTAGGVAFAVMLLTASVSLQSGSYATMIDTGTGLYHGHIQIQHEAYQDHPKLRTTVPDASVLVADLRRQPLVAAVAPRLSAYALVSDDERSFGAQLLGVDPDVEPRVSSIARSTTRGRFIKGGSEAFIGEALASNLGIEVGDEIITLGSDREGGLAALALEVVGIFETGLADLDRATLEIPIETFREAYGMGDEVHHIAIRLHQAADSDPFAAQLNQELSAGLRALHWRELLPELEQSIELDRVSSVFFYSILALLVLFSVVNTFIMTVFERTHEFGLLIALGVRRWGIIGMLQLEALWMSLVGVTLGLVLVAPLLVWMIEFGIPMGDSAELMRQFHMPDRLYGGRNVLLMGSIPIALIIACQLAAFLPFQKVRRIIPADALRVD
ncbi:MAG: ABC transporter permease [Gammaproteobacteria bacterium]|nr:MAG: ABC transporter permease [Gammaproteobacteria bacterium]